MDNKSRKTILLVEDEALIALMEMKHLQASGYDVIHVTTGEKAVEIASSHDSPIDLILMDIDLGSGIDGTTAAQMILQERKIPVLFLSSHTEPEIVEKTEEITSFGYVVKDSSFTVLHASIKMAFRLNEVMREKEKYAGALQDSTNLIKESQAAASIGSYKTDLINGTWESSDVLDEIFGIDKNYDKSIKGWLMLVHPDDRDMMNSYLADEVIGQGKPFNKQYRIRRLNDQQIRWVLGLGRVSRDENGRVYSLVGTIQDITETKKAVDELAHKEALLSATQSISNTGSWELNLEDNSLIWSDETYRIFGFEDRSFGGTYEAVLNTVHPDDRKNLDEAFRKSVENGDEGYEVEHRIIVNNTKEMRWVLEKCYHVRNKKGHIVRSVGMVQDITENKKMEAALKSTEHRFSEVVNNLPMMISVVDAETLTYKFVNQFYEKILKRSSGHIVGRSISEVIGEENFKTAMAGIDEVKQGQIAHVEGTFEGPEGKKWLSLSYVPLYDDNGKVFEYIVLGFDITHLKETEEELNKKNREMTELLSQKDLLIKEVHHRIKNNMMMVFSLISLQADMQECEEAKDVLMNAAGRIKSMSLLYERLYSTDYQGTVNSMVYLRPFIREVFSSFSINDKIKLTTDINDIIINPRKISPLFVILNELITNSMKYAFRERESGEITVAMHKNGSRCRLAFADNGTGMPDEALKGNSKGFGLNLVRILVQQIEGTLDITNEDGTRFVIEFE